MPRQQRSDADLRQVSEHLAYEMGMMQALAHALALGLAGHGSPASNAFLEAFVIHFRCTLAFFYDSKPRPDDAVADDFFDKPADWERLRPAQSGVLKKAKTRADKEMAHLTYARLAVKPTEKGWAFVDIADELTRVVNAFLQHVDKNKLGSSWQQHAPPLS